MICDFTNISLDLVFVIVYDKLFLPLYGRRDIVRSPTVINTAVLVNLEVTVGTLFKVFHLRRCDVLLVHINEGVAVRPHWC